MEVKNKYQTIDTVIIIVSIIAGLISIIFLTSLCGNYFLFKGELNIQATGNVGDFFGGVVGSFIGLISVLLLFKTLLLQKDALQNQQDEINNNIISNKLQRGTDLLIVLVTELKKDKNYEDILSINNQLGEREISLEFLKIHLTKIETLLSKIELHFNVINKLIYQDGFDVIDMNLLRLIVFNRLGSAFFSFLNNLNYFVSNRNNFKSVEDEVELIVTIQNVKYYLIKPLNNSKHLNEEEIVDIINNYKAEDNVKEIRLEDWLKISNKKA